MITQLVDEGHSVDLLYLDFAKAFDTVPHVRLISKVRAHGIDGNIAEWIKQWLTNRKQRVVLNGKASPWSNVLSGVPQGSVLGPCLFLIYINDIDSAIDSTFVLMMKFADDTKIAAIVETSVDCRKLQDQINNLFKWSQKWQAGFNIDKCKVMHLGGQKNSHHQYTLGGEVLKTTEVEKDIGVYIHTSLTPSVQVAEAAKKANKALYGLLKCLTYRDKVHYIKLYKIHVRCHLECAIQAWNPWLKRDIDLLESVQRRAISYVRGLHGQYEEKLKQVNLTTLLERRNRGDMIQTYKILHRVDDVDYHTWFTKADEGSHHSTRLTTEIADDGEQSATLNLKKKNRARLALREHFFSNRVVNNWNKLPNNVKFASDVNNFKVEHDKYAYTD